MFTGKSWGLDEVQTPFSFVATRPSDEDVKIDLSLLCCLTNVCPSCIILSLTVHAPFTFLFILLLTEIYDLFIHLLCVFSGFSGNGFVCNDIDECQLNNGGCSPYSQCYNTYVSQYVCVCVCVFDQQV